MKHPNRTRPLVHTLRACALAALVTAHAFAAEPVKRTYDLPAGDAASSLGRFSAVSGCETLFAAEAVRGVKTAAVSGELTPEQAITAMLAGTGLVAAIDEKTGAFAIRRDSIPNSQRVDGIAKSVHPAKANEGEITPAKMGRNTHPVKAQDKEVVLDRMEVTGSRIHSLVGSAGYNPMLSFSRQDIEHAGVTTIGELSRLIPQAYSSGSYDGMGFGGQQTGTSTTSDGSTASATSTGRSTFNLRGLGTQNTLVLVNGRRIARNGVIRGNDASDLSGIPVASIERVEVLVGGASAIYGSDAVGGVINIILRRNFSGGELVTSYENTFSSDTAARTATLTYGITRDKLELQISATGQDRNAFAAVDRTFSATDDWTTLGGTSSLSDVGVSFAAGGFATGAGIIQAVSGNLPGRTSPYAVIPDGAGTTALPASAYASVTGNSFGVPAYTGDRAKYVNLIAPQESVSTSVRGTYRLSPRHDLYFEGRYSHAETKIEGLPVNYRNYMEVPADYPGNPFGVDVILNKTFWELGSIAGQKTAIDSNAALTAGLRGSLPFGDWRYDAGIDWTQAYLADEDAYGVTLNQSRYDALIASRSLVLFYDSRTQSPNDLNVLRSLLEEAGASERNTTGSVTASADGSVWDLPAGPIKLAFGGEYRTERANTWQAIPDSSAVNLSLLGKFNRDTEAVFAETRVPLLSERQAVPLIHSLDLSLAARYDTYSDMGGHTSPGYGIIYRPEKWLILRGSRNNAFRAPGLQQLYRPVTSSTTTVSSSANVIDHQRGDTRVAAGTYTTTIGGNLGLKPEKSTSDSIGLVLESPFALLKGLSFSVDYQLLDYTDRLQTLTLQQTFDYFPERVTRGANLPTDPTGWAGVPTKIDTRTANIAKLEVEAIDYQISYRRATRWGSFDASLAMTDYIKYLARSVPTATPTNSIFQYPTRVTWQTHWTKGPYGFGVSGFYQEKQYRTITRTTLRWDSAIEWNTQVSYDFDRRRAAAERSDTPVKRWLLAGTKLSLTINNVLDREPPHAQGQAGFGVTDPRMARYILSLRKSF